MPPAHTLELATTSPAAAEFRLLDAGGVHLDYHAVDFAQQPAGLVEGVFNLRDYLMHYTGGVEDVGVFLAEKLLGRLFR